ncbi:UNVERIFIED_CONTAM: hypothetical protein O8I53_05260 [Campylobacter lari]
MDLPHLIDELCNNEPENKNYFQLKQELLFVQNSFTDQAFQQVIEKVRKIYINYYNYRGIEMLNNEFKNYMNQNQAAFEKNINELAAFINHLDLFFADDKLYGAKYQTLYQNFKMNYEEFNQLKINLKENKIDYLGTNMLFESFSKLIYELNELINLENTKNYKKTYTKYYIQNLNHWFFKLLSKKDLLENNSNNNKQIETLAFLKEKINALDLENIDLYNELIGEFSTKLHDLYIKIYKAFLYKEMAEKLIKKITLNNIHDDNEVDEILKIANKYLLTKKYKDAFDLATSFYERGKKYVYKNTY